MLLGRPSVRPFSVRPSSVCPYVRFSSSPCGHNSPSVRPLSIRSVRPSVRPSVSCSSVRPAVVRESGRCQLTHIPRDTIYPYLVEGFQWNIPQTFLMCVGMLLRSFLWSDVKDQVVLFRQRDGLLERLTAVYKCMNAAEAYISTVWLRGWFVFFLYSFRWTLVFSIKWMNERMNAWKSDNFISTQHVNLLCCQRTNVRFTAKEKRPRTANLEY